MGGREKAKTGKHRGAGPGARGPGRAGGRDDPCGPRGASVQPYGVDMVILKIRPQTLLSGTRHAPGIIKYDSAPRLPSVRVIIHTYEGSIHAFFALFGQFWLGILLV